MWLDPLNHSLGRHYRLDTYSANRTIDDKVCFHKVKNSIACTIHNHFQAFEIDLLNLI